MRHTAAGCNSVPRGELADVGLIYTYVIRRTDRKVNGLPSFTDSATFSNLGFGIAWQRRKNATGSYVFRSIDKYNLPSPSGRFPRISAQLKFRVLFNQIVKS
jgi:hypothetical protein